MRFTIHNLPFAHRSSRRLPSRSQTKAVAVQPAQPSADNSPSPEVASGAATEGRGEGGRSSDDSAIRDGRDTNHPLQRFNALTLQRFNVSTGGFTMMEIAISLAVIGIALVAIIGVLPIGMNVQQANREETIIGQDANVLMESIRNASLGNDDLTNYIYAITNYWTQFNVNGTTKTGVNGYTYAFAFNASGYPVLGNPLTNAANIIGLLSTPEYIGAANGGRGISSGSGSADVGGDVPGQPIPNILYGGISNHIVAYCYSVSGPAIQKPPQDNPILQQDSFGYHVYCVNAPMPIDTNLFSPLWTGGTAYSGPLTIPVFYNWTYWNLLTNSSTASYGNPAPGNPPWVMSPNYTLEQALNLHEVRLTFEWPALAKGNVGPSRETFRTMVAGQLLHQPQLVLNLFGAPANSIWYNANLYCYLPETFTNTP